MSYWFPTASSCFITHVGLLLCDAASLITSAQASQISLSTAATQLLQSLVADQKTTFSWLGVDMAYLYSSSGFSGLLFLPLSCGVLPCARPEGPRVWGAGCWAAELSQLVWRRSACPAFRTLPLTYNRASEQGRAGAVSESCWVDRCGSWEWRTWAPSAKLGAAQTWQLLVVKV